jgi:hypothetical protein
MQTALLCIPCLIRQARGALEETDLVEGTLIDREAAHGLQCAVVSAETGVPRGAYVLKRIAAASGASSVPGGGSR